jgi:hypothetical protein
MECLYLWHTCIEGKNFEQIIWDKSVVWMETHWELREHHGENKYICNSWNIIENIVRKPPQKIHAPSPNHGSININYIISKKWENFYKNLKETKLCEGRF